MKMFNANFVKCLSQIMRIIKLKKKHTNMFPGIQNHVGNKRFDIDPKIKVSNKLLFSSTSVNETIKLWNVHEYFRE